MKEVTSTDIHQELRLLGIETLSGESCNMGLRVTTDISPDTVPLIEEFLAIDLRSSGWNGWSREASYEPWQPGRSRAWDFKESKLREGWETADGKSIHLPYVLLPDLFVFLTLRKTPAEVVLRAEPIARSIEGIRFTTTYLVSEDREEFNVWYEELHEIVKAFEADDGWQPGIHSMHHYLGRWGAKGVLTWRLFFGQNTKTNVHQMSGRQLV